MYTHLGAYLCTSLACFAASAAYHTLVRHSERGAALWARVDYAAILLRIPGSVGPGLHFGFYWEPALRRMYWPMISFPGPGRRPGGRQPVAGGPQVAGGVDSDVHRRGHSRFPGCWKPGRFDIFGASHQIFHVVSALYWDHENARCPLLELGV
ncbi:hypothetical protein RB595_000094 [Gaeumannomyces hyphopodioides]